MKKIISILAIAYALASCNNDAANKQTEQLAAQQRTLDSVKNAMAQQHAVDSMNALMATQQQATAQQQGIATPHHAGQGTRVIERNTVTNTSTIQSQGNAPAAAPEKKRWSAKATGTLVGAGVGAITGAMVDKKKGEGAVVGGVLGAAAGLGTGAIIDKRKKNRQDTAGR